MNAPSVSRLTIEYKTSEKYALEIGEMDGLISG
jgi:hypothetical protein